MLKFARVVHVHIVILFILFICKLYTSCFLVSGAESCESSFITNNSFRGFSFVLSGKLLSTSLDKCIVLFDHRTPCKEKEEKVDRRRVWKTILRSVQGFTLLEKISLISYSFYSNLR